MLRYSEIPKISVQFRLPENFHAESISNLSEQLHHFSGILEVSTNQCTVRVDYDPTKLCLDEVIEKIDVAFLACEENQIKDGVKGLNVKENVES